MGHSPRIAGGTWSGANGQPCAPLTTCGAGEYERGEPDAQTDRDCFAADTCPHGHYTFKGPTETDDRVCHSILTCVAGRYQTATPGQLNRECTDCDAGEYQNSQNQGSASNAQPESTAPMLMQQR